MRDTSPESSNGPLRVAFLGAGEIATTHLAAVKNSPGVELVAVCDRDRERARAFQQLGGVPHAFEDLDAMLGGVAPDVVHVLLPPTAHAAAAERCLAAGSHVFVEKPFCVTVEECRRVQAAAGRAGRQVGVDHNLAFMPAFVKAVDAVRGCRLGAVEHMSVIFNLPMPGLDAGPHTHWMFAATGNLMLETGVHPVSTVCRVLGGVERAATAVSGEMTLRNGTRFFRSWQSALVCERGTAQCLLAVGAGFYSASVHLIGEDGEAVADLRRNTILVSEKRPHVRADDLVDARTKARSLASQGARNFRAYGLGAAGLRPAYSVQVASVTNSLASFYGALRAGRAPEVGGAEGTAVIEACYLIIESAMRFADQAGGGLVAHR